MNGHAWTAEQLELLQKLYPDTPTRDVAKACGHPIGGVYKYATKLGLKKSEAFNASPASGRLEHRLHCGAAYRFKKGIVPANKGLRRPGYAPGRMRETQFKKGQLSPRCQKLYKPIGFERVNDDGYRERKVTEAGHGAQRWRAVHRLLWEEKVGPIPPGHAVVFKDGDKTHIAIDNLECISRAELGQRNSVHRLPKALAQVIQLRGALQRQINRRQREKQGRGLT